MRFVLISGLSGAGKSTALRALDDAGFFVTDNLPPALWLELYERAEQSGIHRLAVSTDVRAHLFFGEMESQLEALFQKTPAQLIFLEASTEVLLQRYNLTRRVHPLGDSSLFMDFRREHEILAPLRARADVVIDTTALETKTLSERITSSLRLEQEFALGISSFGFKHAPPRDSDLVLDVRGLPNPYYDPNLRYHTGLEPEVVNYVFTGVAEEFYVGLREYVRSSAHLARLSGRRSYSVAIGCTGGRHRSVAVAERLALELSDWNARVTDHRDIEKVER
jgi:RNase adapter protein RapZ